MTVYDVSIIHMQGHIYCIQDAAEYGNVIQTCRSAIFEDHQWKAVESMHGFTLKEQGCNDSRFIII